MHDFPQELLIIKEYLLVTLAQVEHHLWRPYNLPSGSPCSLQKQSFVLPCLPAFALRLQGPKSFKSKNVIQDPTKSLLDTSLTPSLRPKSFAPALTEVNNFLKGRLIEVTGTHFCILE